MRCIRIFLFSKDILFYPSSYQTEFQINAILRQSLSFSKLQNITFLEINSEEVDEEEVDQEILNEAAKVIANIFFHDVDDSAVLVL